LKWLDRLIKRFKIILLEMIEDEGDLLEEYNFDIVGCHPPNIGDSIPSFEDFKRHKRKTRGGF